jgi:hypothetical protein
VVLIIAIVTCQLPVVTTEAVILACVPIITACCCCWWGPFKSSLLLFLPSSELNLQYTSMHQQAQAPTLSNEFMSHVRPIPSQICRC